MQRIYSRTTLSLLLASFIIAGCGSDGGGAAIPQYNGITTAATIDAANAEEIGTGSSQGANEAIATETSSNGNPFFLGADVNSNNSSALSKKIVGIVNEINNQLPNNLISGITITSAELMGPFCGGSISAPDNFSAGGTLNGSITFNNLCYDDGLSGQIIMNGTITFTQTATEISMALVNFSVTFDGGTSESLNATITCDTSFISCSFSSVYTGIDGKTYKISDYTVAGSPAAGFTVNGIFFHPDHGSVTFTTTQNIFLNCTGPQPSAGAISFTGGSGTSGSITFVSCAEYTYCYNLGGGPTCASGIW